MMKAHLPAKQVVKDAYDTRTNAGNVCDVTELNSTALILDVTLLVVGATEEVVEDADS